MPHPFRTRFALSALLLAALALVGAPHAGADDAQTAYAAKRAALKGDDQSGRYTLLVEFYLANEKTPEAVQFAKSEAEQLAKDFPDSTQIKKLARVIADRASHADEPETPPAEAGKQEPPSASEKPDAAKDGKGDGKGEKKGDKDAPLPPAAPAVGLLSPKDQNLLRLYELDFVISKGHAIGADAKASVVVPKEVLEDLLKNHPDAEELAKYKGKNGLSALRNLPPLAQLDLIIAVQDKTLYPKIEIKSEPVPLQVFRSQIHPHLARHFTVFFAGQVQGLIAKPKNLTSQQEAYTNFLALSLATVDGHPVIDRADPADSLILQWGLPRVDAKYPAPNIKGWKPCFRSAKDENFLKIAQWIKSLYGEATPNYGINLPPADAAGKPAGPAVPPGPGGAPRHVPTRSPSAN